MQATLDRGYTSGSTELYHNALPTDSVLMHLLSSLSPEQREQLLFLADSSTSPSGAAAVASGITVESLAGISVRVLFTVLLAGSACPWVVARALCLSTRLSVYLPVQLSACVSVNTSSSCVRAIAGVMIRLCAHCFGNCILVTALVQQASGSCHPVAGGYASGACGCLCVQGGRDSVLSPCSLLGLLHL